MQDSRLCRRSLPSSSWCASRRTCRLGPVQPRLALCKRAELERIVLAVVPGTVRRDGRSSTAQPSFGAMPWHGGLAALVLDRGARSAAWPSSGGSPVRRSAPRTEWAPERGHPASGRRGAPTLLYGAGRTGALMARSARREPDAGVMPVGFLDDDPHLAGGSVAGLPVFGGLDQLERGDRRTGARIAPDHDAERPGRDDPAGHGRGRRGRPRGPDGAAASHEPASTAASTPIACAASRSRTS